ncbi:hypothetical protein [Streptomyces sp. NPDC057781]|uniref:hypothetical protein n=1 Tax=unclassified Streptomyces TaxID=2593676 RepID=UPI00369B8308
MEQRRGSTSQPLEGAGFDPAFVPGLTAPVTGEPEDVRSEKEAEEEPEDVRVADGTAASEPAEQAGEPEEEEEAPDPGGPVFEAADRRARIVADHKGVRLSLDDQSCEFRWNEVGAVETETGRFGKRFTVTVHTPDRRWYPIEIEASSRSRFPEWESALDEVLDAYFEDGETRDEAGPESEADAKPEAGPESEADAKSEVESEAEASAKSEAGLESEADAEPEAEPETKPEAKADAKREADGDE